MPSVRGTLGVKVIVLGGDMPFVRGTLGVKVCVLGGAMFSVRGTLGCKDKELVSVLGGAVQVQNVIEFSRIGFK